MHTNPFHKLPVSCGLCALLICPAAFGLAQQQQEPSRSFWQSQQRFYNNWQQRSANQPPPQTYPAYPGYPGYVPPRPQYRQGEDVRLAQLALKRLGYYQGSADGVQGPGTTEALRKFQAESGLSADGLMGPATRAALEQQSGTSLSVADASEKVLTVKIDSPSTKTLSTDPIPLDQAPASKPEAMDILPSPAPVSANPVASPGPAQATPAPASTRVRPKLDLESANPQADPAPATAPAPN
jgi:hypothetical protein